MGNSAFKRSINNATRTRVNFLTPFYLTTRPNDLRPRLYNSNTKYTFPNRNVLYLSEEPPVPPSTSIASSTVCAAPSIFKLFRFSAFSKFEILSKSHFQSLNSDPSGSSSFCSTTFELFFFFFFCFSI